MKYEFECTYCGHNFDFKYNYWNLKEVKCPICNDKHVKKTGKESGKGDVYGYEKGNKKDDEKEGED